MKDLLKQFQSNWHQFQSRIYDQPILLAISGGKDSMVLAHLLLNSSIPFQLAHCNFGLRGAESDGDEDFVRQWAKQNQLTFWNVKFDTKAIVLESKMGIQEVARKLRYDWLEKIRKENNCCFIATAHHAHDNAETVLMNFFKGTGISGMHGIKPVFGKIIRPLLFASNEDIQQYCKEKKIVFREDSSNSSDKYLRNAVRHHVLTAVESFFPNAVQQMNESIERFADVEIIYKEQINRMLKRVVQTRGADDYISILALKKIKTIQALSYEILQQYGFQSGQVPFFLQLLTAPSGKFIVNEQYKIIKNRDFLIVTKNQTTNADFILIDNLPASINLIEGTLQFKYVQNELINFNISKSEAFINADACTFPLVLRRWKTGDYFYPFGMNMKKKKLSKFFMDKKIAIHEKEKVWVLESDKRIVWVVGMRIDERFKITEKTTQKLHLKWKPN